MAKNENIGSTDRSDHEYVLMHWSDCNDNKRENIWSCRPSLSCIYMFASLSLPPCTRGGSRSSYAMVGTAPRQSFPIDRNNRFRVVDEINQGMDPTNERLIFEQIVRCSKEASPGRPMPQYFMVCSTSLAHTFFFEVS